MPTLTVVGNCQAESTRRLLMTTGLFDSERIAPVHELAASDMEWFTALIARTDVLVVQPIRDGYRGLPVGTRQLVSLLPRGARWVVVPVLRYDGPMPYTAIIRNPLDTSENPPVVPYHDLRLLAAAAREMGVSGAAAPASPAPAPSAAAPAPSAPKPAALRRAAAMSVAQMRAREQAYGTVIMSDYLETVPVWHTVNHPDNATLGVLAQRVLEALGVGAGHSGHGSGAEVQLPDYEMLGGLLAPIDRAAAEALGIDPAVAEARTEWVARPLGSDQSTPIPTTIDAARIAEEQLAFYRERPELVAHGLVRHADRLANLGLA